MSKTKLTDIALGENVVINVGSAQQGKNVSIGNNVAIIANELVLHDNCRIDDNVTIKAEKFELGYGSAIETGTVLSGLKGSAKLIRIGDNTLIANDCKIINPITLIGDYVAIQNHTLANGLKPIIIGHNCWFGQNCVLNANDNLTIGNNVGVGAYSSLYTHGFFGDLLEGCQVNKVAPVTLKDDVWILGCYNIISPGVTIGEKALILTGSNVVRDIPANHTVGGAPAKDMTDRLVPYKDVTPDEKFEKIQEFILKYLEDIYPGKYSRIDNGYNIKATFGRFTILFIPECDDSSVTPKDYPQLIFTKRNIINNRPENVTIFDLSQREYTKTRTTAEIKTISYLKNPHARFVPNDMPRVTLPGEFLNENR